jgi:release factor glutamine methyltransferase
VKTIAAVLADIRQRFQDAGIENPEADARLLAQHGLSLSREKLFMNQNEILEDSQVEILERYADRRLRHEPVSRIIGKRSFWKSDFKISPETLDPRADSETLIEAVLRQDMPQQAWVLDLGTGSGCLLLSLLQELPGARGVGVDISADAVKTAQENAENLGLSTRATFIAGDWNDVRIGRRFDVIISNPPYITDHEMAALAPEVALHDPARALKGGADGLDCYRNIINILPDFLKEKGYIFFEIGRTQAQAVKDLLEQSGLVVLETAPDLGKNDRCIAARAADAWQRE